MSRGKPLGHLETEGEPLIAKVSPALDTAVAAGSCHDTIQRDGGLSSLDMAEWFPPN